jgi:hypothetical protein
VKKLFTFQACILFLTLCGCVQNEDLLEALIAENPDVWSIADDPDYEVQILYTQTDRGPDQKPIFTTYAFKVDSGKYFYPASTVKLPVALLSLEKLAELNVNDLDRNTTMLTDSTLSGRPAFYSDSSASDYQPSVAQYIKKILLVSDNEAYNRLYEFLGVDELNARLRQKEYGQTQIIHRLSEVVPRPRTKVENLTTNPIRFVEKGKTVYVQPEVVSSFWPEPNGRILRGKGYIKNDSLITEPFDFTFKNRFGLEDQHRMLQAIIFPELFPKNSFNLSVSDHQFILRYMSMYPGESDIAQYHDSDMYPDKYVKFLLFGAEKGNPPDNIRIFNKVGNAYGYLIDNAYIIDADNGVEFFLSAVIHVNSNRIFNDGNYEYDEIGFPFMKNLGELIYEYELSREKSVVPDFTKINY